MASPLRFLWAVATLVVLLGLQSAEGKEVKGAKVQNVHRREAIIQEEEEGEAGCVHSTFAERSSVFVIAVVLIALSVLFEHAKEKIEDMTQGSMRAVVDSLWGELTVLGFIALVTFMVSKTQALHDISVHVFSDIEDEEERKEKLPELVEKCHFLLFAMMLGYISLVFLLIIAAKRIEREYNKMEEECAIPHKVFDRYYKVMTAGNPAQRSTVCRMMQYFVTRQQFIAPGGHMTPQKVLRQNFDFSSYLSKTLGKFLSYLVELNGYTWAAMLVLITIFWALGGLGARLQLMAFQAYGYFLVLLAALVWFKLHKAGERVLPPIPYVDTEVGDLEKSEEKVSILAQQAEDEEDNYNETLKELGIRTPSYLYSGSAPRPRGKLGDKFLGPPPNLHEAQFWFDRAGPVIHFQITQLVLIGTALYLAALFTNILGSVWVCFHGWQKVAIYLSTAVPVTSIFILTPEIVRLHGLLTNIEMMKEQKIIVEVQREMKTRASLTAIKLLQNIMVRTRSSDEKGGKEGKEEMEKIALSQKQISYLRDVFCLFDKDRSGTISTEEISSLFTAVGVASTEDEVKLAISELDHDSSGDVTFEEFCDYMATRMNEPMDEEESLEAMFKYFDHDGDGHVSAQEFWKTVQALGVDFTIDEIRALISEVDESGDGEIDLEEFSTMMRHHLAAER